MTATPSETSEGWYNYTFTIPSTYNTASNYIIFKAISGFGFNIYMDDISVQRNVVTSPGCLTSFLLRKQQQVFAEIWKLPGT
ncbi:MAG: hypothetical protein IPH42_14725 [Bacteroidetes bacterium]|nr:hypothetical protein [Bacteroidota bacterium]